MASKQGVTIIVAGEDKSGEVFRAVQQHLAETRTKAKETSASLGEMGEYLKRSLSIAGIAVGIHEVASGLKEMITHSMEAAVQINKLRQETGITAENLSLLKFAAQSSGVEFETVAKAGKKLAEAIHDTDAGKLAEGFKVLGISTDEVKSKGNNMYGVMALIADKFREMPDGIDKNVAATKLFGKAGQEMIPILNQGAAALEDLKSKAPIFTDSDIEKLEKMHKATAALSAEWDKASLTMASGVAPALTQWFALIASGEAPVDSLKRKVSDLVVAFLQLHDAVKLPTIDLSKHFVPKPPPGWETPTTPASKPPASKGVKGHESEPILIDTSDAELDQLMRDHAADRRRREEAAAREAQQMIGTDWESGAADLGAFQQAPKVRLAPPEKDYTDLKNFGEKYAHGLFDPLFDLSTRWDQKWKQMRDNLLRDLGQTVESQLFGVMFGDPSGRGGRGWNGGSWEHNPEMPGRTGLASGALGQLMGLFHHDKAASTSNGGLGAGAGTVATAAASVMQAGKASGGGVQVVINNQGPPMAATATQHMGDGGEGNVIQIMLKQVETNGPIVQALAAALLP